MLFLLQSLGGFSCAEMVAMLGASKAVKGSSKRSPRPGGYCQAMTLRRGGQFVFPLRSRTGVKKLGGGSSRRSWRAEASRPGSCA